MTRPMLDVQVEGVKETQAAIDHTARGLDPASSRMRQAIADGASQLERALVAAAAGSPTPQARLVAESITTQQAVAATVRIGGGQPVGSRGTPAGELVTGSEYGGHNFAAPRNSSGYWITPTLRREQQGGQVQKSVQDGVDQAIREAGF